jgi:hypothetical protein
MIEAHFRKLGAFISAGSDYTHPKALKKLANVIVRPPAFISENQEWTGEGHDKQSQQVECLVFRTWKKTQHK